MSKKVYLNIPANDDEDVEKYDIKRDMFRHMWYVYEGSKDYDLLINKYDVIDINVKKVDEKFYLFVPFIYKDDAKGYRARWDADKKQWYTIEGDMCCGLLKDIFRRENFKYNAMIKKYDYIGDEPICGEWFRMTTRRGFNSDSRAVRDSYTSDDYYKGR